MPVQDKNENNLKNAEIQLEDDYNSIDGIINNGNRNEIQTAAKDIRSTVSSLQKLIENPYISENMKKEAENDIKHLQTDLKKLDTALESLPNKFKKINPDYYKSLENNNRYITIEPEKIAESIMKQLDEKNIPYSAVERKNQCTAITVSKSDEQTYKEISKAVKAERAAIYIHPEFYKELPKEERATQRMSQENAENKVNELEKQGIPHSAVLNGNKSAVTVSKKDSKTAFFSRKDLKEEAQKLNKSSENKEKPKTKNQEI